MAGSYQAKIDVIIGGLREVAALEGRLESLQATITAINKAPVDLNVGGRGKGRDLSGKLSKNVNDLVRNFNNFGKSFSSVNKQAVLFGDLMSQTALKSTGEFKKQDVAVKNLATAYTTATNEAARFERQQINLIRTSKGLQTSTQREIDLIKKRTRVSRLREKKRRGQNLQQDILLGAGFPLLFGGGAGAVAGGLTGALIGQGKGGFGAQIFGSAIGQQFDAVVDKAVTLGKALNPLTFNLEAVASAAGIAGTKTVQFLENIERYAGATEAARLATKLLETRIGKEGVKSLQDFGKAAQDLGNALSTIFTQVLANIAKVAGPLLQNLGRFAGQVADVATFKDRPDLEGTEKLAQDILKGGLGKTGTGGLGVSTIGASGIKERARKLLGPGADLSDKALREFAIKTAQSSQRKLELPVLQEIEQISGQVTPPSRASNRASEEAERVKQRIDALRREREEIVAISGIKDKIALAEAANDSQLVIKLQGEQRLRQIETERLNDLAKAKTAEEARAINQTAIVKALAAQLETGRQLTEDQRQRQELFDDTLEGLKFQLEMAEATSQAERDRLKIAREIKKLDDKGFSDAQLGQAEAVMKQLAVAQQPLNAFIRKTTEDLNNLQQVAVDVSQGIGNAIGSSLVNGLQSLVTGAASIKEVFANMLKSVADVLANTAAKMIAQYIAIGIARMFAGMGGGGGSSTPDPFSSNVASVLPDTGNLADIAVSTPLKLANGGYVSGPTNAIVGEGGQGEYVIPESKMRESMSRYSRGARGSSVIPETSSPEASGEGGGTAVAAPIDVRYTVDRINSVDYVTADQFQAGMRQAANEGAKQGEQQTLKRLQMSSSTRKRVGM